jgi:hypothetical protein
MIRIGHRWWGAVTGGVIAGGLCLPLAAHAQQAHRLECPRQAPPEWGLPKPAPLEQPAVLSQPNGEPINEGAPPSLMPDQMYAEVRCGITSG